MGKQGRKGGLRFAWRVTVLLANGLGLIFLALALALAVGAYYVLPRVADSTQVKAFLVERLQDSLHRPVSIGQVLLAPQGVKISAIAIANKNPGEGNLLSGESALVTIKISALLHRRLEISTVRIFRPVIRLVRDENGRWSFSDMFSSAPAAGTKEPFLLSMPVSLNAEKTLVENASVIIEDRYRKRTITFSGLNLTVENPDPVRPFRFSASFNNLLQFKGREIAAACAMSGAASLAGLDISSATISATQVSINVGGDAFNGALSLHDLPHPEISGNFSAPELSRGWLAAQIGRPVDFPWPQSRWSFALAFPSSKLMRVSALNMEARAFSASASGDADFSSSPFLVEAHVKVSSAPLENFSFLAPAISRNKISGILQADASVSGPWNKPRVENADVQLENFSASAKPLSMTMATASVSVSDNFSKISLSAGDGSLQALGHLMTDVSLRAGLAKNRLSVNRLSFDLEGTRAVASGSIRNIARPNQILLWASLNSLRWSAAQKIAFDVASYLSKIKRERAAAAPSPQRNWVAFFKYHIPRRFPATAGRLIIGSVQDQNFWFKNAVVIWSLNGVTPRLDAASGSLRLRLGPGHFDNLQSIIGASKFMEVVFLPYVYMHKMNSFSVLSTAAAYPDTFDFNRIEGQYSARDGVVRTRFFHVDSPQLAAFAQGEADFAKETVDMEVLTRLSRYDAPLPEWWVDELGRPAIGFWVKGSLDHPEIQPRLQKMGANEIEEALAKAEARAGLPGSGQ